MFITEPLIEEYLSPVWLTLLALYILENIYADIESEWQLIAKKARAYLKYQGFTKIDREISSIKLTLK